MSDTYDAALEICGAILAVREELEAQNDILRAALDLLEKALEQKVES
jgi:hypothetical protein